MRNHSIKGTNIFATVTAIAMIKLQQKSHNLHNTLMNIFHIYFFIKY